LSFFVCVFFVLVFVFVLFANISIVFITVFVIIIFLPYDLVSLFYVDLVSFVLIVQIVVSSHSHRHRIDDCRLI